MAIILGGIDLGGVATPFRSGRKLARPICFSLYIYSSAIKPSMVTLAAVAAPFALLNCLKFFHPLGYFGIDDYIFAYGFLLIFFCTARLLPALLRRAVMNHMASMLPDFVRIRKATNSTINQVSSDSSASENKQQSLDKTINDLTKEIDTIMAYEDQLKFVLSDLSKDSHLYKVYSAQLSLTERIRQKAVKTIASYSRKADHD